MLTFIKRFNSFRLYSESISINWFFLPQAESVSDHYPIEMELRGKCEYASTTLYTMPVLHPLPPPWAMTSKTFSANHWPSSTTSMCYVKWKLILVYVSCLISFWIWIKGNAIGKKYWDITCILYIYFFKSIYEYAC